MIYRKRGSSVRWENGVLVSVSEAGIVTEEHDLFSCEPEARDALPWPDADVVAVARQIETLAREVAVERLIVSAGIAEHECDGRMWSDETWRVHVALAHRGLRALVDLATFDTSEIAPIADALARCTTSSREAPARLRLAPNVTAALLPSLAGLAPPNVELWQTGGGIDGNGEAILEQRIAAPPYPNVYRPTYRMRPVRVPLNLQLRCAVADIDETRPRAIALLAPIDGLTLHVLVEDAARVYPATVRLVRIDAVAPPAAWYPYGAGSFGAEMML
ncbi:MAG: hypothetical protein JO197_16560 [Acidobacteria bacterium]|nr:hypothetical protein [Acidobacteriota bacterium]MBV9475415.1 hypothetical protein [Acidobacteriota bacterium]